MIKHYDRFIGGHDSAAINHSATSNRRRRKRRRRRPIFNDDVAPATSSLLSSRNWRRKSGSIFGEIFGEKGRGGFLTVYVVRVQDRSSNCGGIGERSQTRQQRGNSGHNYVREPRNRVGNRSPLYRAYRACLDYYTSWPRMGLKLPRTRRIISVHDSITDCRPNLLMTLSIKRQGQCVLAYRGSHSCNCPDGNSSRGSSSFFQLYIYIYILVFDFNS